MCILLFYGWLCLNTCVYARFHVHIRMDTRVCVRVYVHILCEYTLACIFSVED